MSDNPPGASAPITMKQARAVLEEWMLNNLASDGETVTPELIAKEVVAWRQDREGEMLSLREARAFLNGLAGGRGLQALADDERAEYYEMREWLVSLGLPPGHSLSADEEAVLTWYRNARIAAADCFHGGAGQVRVLMVGDSEFVGTVDHQLDHMGGGLTSYLHGEQIVEAEHVSPPDPDEETPRKPESKLSAMGNGLIFRA
jgi:hypothetical protein